MTTAHAVDRADAIENALREAQTDSIESQLVRWFSFAGEPAWIELQALKIRGDVGSWERSRYAHADDVRTASRLATTADKWTCPGVYLIANPILDAVATRSPAGQWHDAGKGDGTSDAEIAARSVLFIDIDAKRPKGTSATSAEIEHTSRVAGAICDELATILEDDRSLAVGASGNGRAVFLALDMLDTLEAGKRHHAILIALAARYSDAHVEIDRVVHDAKRLVPCWGTTKKKGAPGVEHRPHRRTSFVVAADHDHVARVSMADLDTLVASLRSGLDDSVQRDIDRALGAKSSPSSPSSTDRVSGESPWARANATPIADVLSWLSLLDGDRPTCSGCALSDSGVAIVGNGVKCSHARCAGKGVRDGFRTPVDVVMEARGLSSPREAVALMAERFGFEGFGSKENTSPEQQKQQSKGPRALVTIGVDALFAPLPTRKWICDRLRIAGSGRPALFVGPPAGGKTIVVETLVVDASVGRRWCGLHDVTTSRVLWLDGEVGPYLTPHRIQRIAKARGVTAEEIGDRLRFAIYPPITLDQPDAEAVLVATCQGFDLVVIDSLSALSGEAEEHTPEMGRLMLMLGRVSGATGAAILVLHHTRRDGETRGSTSIYAGAECIWRMTDVEKGRSTLVHERSPMGDHQPDLTVQIRDVEIDGDPRAGLTVDILEPESEQKRAPGTEHADLMKVIVDHIRSRGPVPGGADVLAGRLSKRQAPVRTAVKELIATGVLVETGTARSKQLRLGGAA